jgi:hypothetical protein
LTNEIRDGASKLVVVVLARFSLNELRREQNLKFKYALIKANRQLENSLQCVSDRRLLFVFRSVFRSLFFMSFDVILNFKLLQGEQQLL